MLRVSKIRVFPRRIADTARLKSSAQTKIVRASLCGNVLAIFPRPFARLLRLFLPPQYFRLGDGQNLFHRFLQTDKRVRLWRGIAHAGNVAEPERGRNREHGYGDFALAGDCGGDDAGLGVCAAGGLGNNAAGEIGGAVDFLGPGVGLGCGMDAGKGAAFGHV